jgi:hypothetical protein
MVLDSVSGCAGVLLIVLGSVLLTGDADMISTRMPQR